MSVIKINNFRHDNHFTLRPRLRAESFSPHSIPAACCSSSSTEKFSIDYWFKQYTYMEPEEKLKNLRNKSREGAVGIHESLIKHVAQLAGSSTIAARVLFSELPARKVRKPEHRRRSAATTIAQGFINNSIIGFSVCVSVCV